MPVSFTMGGRHWRARSCEEDEPVFYDWICGEAGEILGIEVHVDSGHPWHEGLCDTAGIDLAGVFPRVWLSRERDGAPLGLEAFGDLYAYESYPDSYLVVVGLDWLDATSAAGLLAKTEGPISLC